ncbi:MAG: hypothetical protein AMXMBFR84_19340 [Candidatus Hydrogenedentota bacterium]
MHALVVTFALWCATVPVSAATVQPVAETEAVTSSGDAADDPCIWVNASNPKESLIVGTDKQTGLYVYTLHGKLVQSLPDGQMNNVDIRAGFQGRNGVSTLVAATNRTNNTIAIYRLDESTGILTGQNKGIESGVAVYGFCLYRNKAGAMYAFVTTKEGEIVQWRLQEDESGAVTGKRVRVLRVDGQVEGCVADDALAVLYVGEETRGIWRFNAEPNAGDERIAVDTVRPDGRLTADIEGLALYAKPDGKGYLVASCQGSNEFAVYSRELGNAFAGSFQVGATNAIDAVTGTDGIDVCSASLGGAFGHGLFVAQDDVDNSGTQNFKLVAWEAIEQVLHLP